MTSLLAGSQSHTPVRRRQPGPVTVGGRGDSTAGRPAGHPARLSTSGRPGSPGQQRHRWPAGPPAIRRARMAAAANAGAADRRQSGCAPAPRHGLLRSGAGPRPRRATDHWQLPAHRATCWTSRPAARRAVSKTSRRRHGCRRTAGMAHGAAGTRAGTSPRSHPGEDSTMRLNRYAEVYDAAGPVLTATLDVSRAGWGRRRPSRSRTGRTPGRSPRRRRSVGPSPP